MISAAGGKRKVGSAVGRGQVSGCRMHSTLVFRPSLVLSQPVLPLSCPSQAVPGALAPSSFPFISLITLKEGSIECVPESGLVVRVQHTSR